MFISSIMMVLIANILRCRGAHSVISTNSLQGGFNTVELTGHYTDTRRGGLSHDYKVTLGECQEDTGPEALCFKYSITKYYGSSNSGIVFPIDTPNASKYAFSLINRDAYHCRDAVGRIMLIKPADRVLEITSYLRNCMPMALSGCLDLNTVEKHINTLGWYLRDRRVGRHHRLLKNQDLNIIRVIRALQRMDDELFQHYILCARRLEQDYHSVAGDGEPISIRTLLQESFEKSLQTRTHIVTDAARSVYLALLDIHGEKCPSEKKISSELVKSMYKNIHIPLLAVLGKNLDFMINGVQEYEAEQDPGYVVANDELKLMSYSMS